MSSNAFAASRSCATLLGELVKRHSWAVGRHLQRHGVAACDMDDARQRVWLTTARHFDRIQQGRERAFLLTVARREAGHTRRTYRRRSETTEVDVNELVSSALPSDELLVHRQLLEQAGTALQQMNDGLRVVVLLFALEETSTGEIAEFLHIPVGTVKSRLRRARARCLLRNTSCAAPDATRSMSRETTRF